MTADRGIPLVTGATGFAGGHLVESLLERHPRVVAWAHRTPPRDPDPRIEWRTVDLLDGRAVREALRQSPAGVIYHCAGMPHAGDSWRRAEAALRTNALGTHRLLEAVADVSPATATLVVGSALVYRPSTGALREDAPMGPVDPYGTSKLAQEMIASKATTTVFVARPFNHAGPRQHATFVTSSFAQQIAEIEAGRREPRLLVGNLDSRRDITDVRDTVRGYQALVNHGQPRRPYNLCSGTAHRVGDVLERLLGLARIAIRVEQDPARLRPSDNPVVLGDPSRAAHELQWRAEIPIEQTLADLLAWWRSEVARGAP